VRKGEYDISVVKDAPLGKFDHNSPNGIREANGVERKTARRPKIFKSTGWYERAAPSVRISAKP
jgi:hypothetical protein